MHKNSCSTLDMHVTDLDLLMSFRFSLSITLRITMDCACNQQRLNSWANGSAAGMFRKIQVQSAQSVCQVIAHPFHVFIYFLRGDQGVGHSCQWQSFGTTPEIHARVSPPDLVPCIALLWWDLTVQRSRVVVLAVSFCFKEVSFSCCPLTILLFHSTNFFISFLKCLHRGSLTNNK